MDRSHHPVLAVISNCYSEPRGRFPRVTHPCATKAEAFVRLACVRHAASVRSEPGSNSQVCVTITMARNKFRKPSQSNFGSRLPALVKRNGYEGHTSNRLNNRSPEPEDPRTGRRRPHVPSSKPTMSKNQPNHHPRKNPEPTETAGQPSFPIFTPGPGRPSMLATN